MFVEKHNVHMNLCGVIYNTQPLGHTTDNIWVEHIREPLLFIVITQSVKFYISQCYYPVGHCKAVFVLLNTNKILKKNVIKILYMHDQLAKDL